MPPHSSKSLKVSEKFRAPAALYHPSVNKGDGWIEISGPKMGGKAIIQVQADAKYESNDGVIPIVRFQLRHGKDFMNARIKNQLPIHRRGPKEVLFKSVSSSTSRHRTKTVHLIKFESKDDTDDFVMWWLAKNGSTPLGGDDTVKPSKRRLSDRTNFSTGVSPLKKKANKSTTPNKKSIQSPGKTPNKILGVGIKLIHKRTPESDEKKGSHNHHSTDDDTASDNDNSDEEEVDIDDEYAPQSQDWRSAFST